MTRACLVFATVVLSSFLGRAEDLGSVDFPTSGSEAAQQHFIRGILLLHSFEYPDARAAFQEARKVEPGFAMAYWGEAMTHNHPIWDQQDREDALAALELLGETSQQRLAKAPTERERDYLRTLDVLYGDGTKRERDLRYSEAMRQLHEKYPEDLEAASFYALSLLGTSAGERDFATYMQAAAVVEEVFDKNPRHPGAVHYLIHSYDDPIHAPLGLRPARVYAKIAPAAPHALHMPSHIFVARGMWDEVAESNLASWKAAEGGMHGYHALWWLQYAYLQQGRTKEARELLQRIYNDAREHSDTRAITHLARMRGAYLLETRQCRDSEVLAMEVDAARLSPEVAANHWFIETFCALRQSDKESATAIVEKMAASNEDVEAVSAAVKIPLLEAKAALAWAGGRHEEAIRLAREAAVLEDTIPFDFGPPAPFKPAHELLGEMLMEAGDYQDALAEFEKALRRTPRRVLALSGAAQAADALGLDKRAEETYQDLRAIWHRADHPLPTWRQVKEGRQPKQ